MPLKKGSLERLVIVVRNLGENEERHGSVSIELDPYFGPDSDVVTGEKYQQYITLFDHPDDDIYDGQLNENDDEVPRILCEFSVEETKRGDVSRRQMGVSQSMANVKEPS